MAEEMAKKKKKKRVSSVVEFLMPPHDHARTHNWFNVFVINRNYFLGG